MYAYQFCWSLRFLSMFLYNILGGLFQKEVRSQPVRPCSRSREQDATLYKKYQSCRSRDCRCAYLLLLFIAVLFLSGLQIVPMGVIGEYIGRIYTEAKQRALSIGREVVRSASGNPVAQTLIQASTMRGILVVLFNLLAVLMCRFSMRPLGRLKFPKVIAQYRPLKCERLAGSYCRLPCMP